MRETQPVRVRFGVFDLNLKSGEPRSGVRRTLLQEQPLQVLRMTSTGVVKVLDFGLATLAESQRWKRQTLVRRTTEIF